MQVKSVIADFRGKNKDFKKYLAKNKPAPGFKMLLDAEVSKLCKSVGMR